MSSLAIPIDNFETCPLCYEKHSFLFFLASKLSDVPLCNVKSYKKDSSHRSRRHVVSDRTLLWEAGVLPYEIDESCELLLFLASIISFKTALKQSYM